MKHIFIIVWATKYRYLFLLGDIQERCRDLFIQICNHENIQILKGVRIMQVKSPLYRCIIQKNLRSKNLARDNQLITMGLIPRSSASIFVLSLLCE